MVHPLHNILNSLSTWTLQSVKDSDLGMFCLDLACETLVFGKKSV